MSSSLSSVMAVSPRSEGQSGRLGLGLESGSPVQCPVYIYGDRSSTRSALRSRSSTISISSSISEVGVAVKSRVNSVFDFRNYITNKLVSFNSTINSNDSSNSISNENCSDSDNGNSKNENTTFNCGSKSNSESDDLEWEEWDGVTSFPIHMLAGSCAGLAEHISMFPIDTLKTHVQCERCGVTLSSMSPLESWSCAARIVEREGVFRLWRGVGAMFFGTIPAHAAYFSIFEFIKKALGADQPGHHPIAASLCGAAAATAHDLFMTPCDVVKQRMQLGYYKNLSDCFRTIVRQEGWRSLYASLPTTLSMNIPYGMVMVAINETMRKIMNPSGKYSISSSMIAGGVAGAIAAALTNPMDVIKTRLQTQNLEPCMNIKSSSVHVKVVVHTPSLKRSQIKTGVNGAIEVAKAIMHTEGIKGFARGILPRMLTQIPAVAISWSTYEFVKGVLLAGGGGGR